MALLKAQKVELAHRYVQELNEAKNVILLKQYGLPVNELTMLRRGVAIAEGKIQIVKKRVFLKGIEGKYDGVTLDTLDGSIVVLYSYNEGDENAPLKAIHKQKKVRAKEKAVFGFDYLGGWYDKVRHTSDYVSELAGLPSKEELIGKFLFLLNHPVASFARVLQAIADKDGSVVETAPEAPKAGEAPVEEAKPEAPVAEMPTAAAEQQAESQEQAQQENQEEQAA